MKSLKKPIISIVIINKNDKGIDNTLLLVRGQKIRVPYETIVVDASEEKLNNIYNKYEFIIKIPFKRNTSKSITIPEQRNIGIKHARGRIIVFIDANCKPKLNWLVQLTTPILDNEEYVTAGMTLSEKGKSFHDQRINSTAKTYLSEAPTINLAISRDVFDKVGLFDEHLNYGSDMDFTRRCILKGYRILQVPSAQITHNWGDLRQETKRSYRYGEAKARLYKTHLEPSSLFVKREFTLVIYSAFIILFIPATIYFPYYPLLLLLPLLKNINNDPIGIVISNIITAIGALKEIVLH